MEKWEATYKVTTPLFMGGPDQEKAAELRAPSLKGVLRFWYRAVALPLLGTWRAVREAEAELFGSTSGQARVLLNMSRVEGLRMVRPDNRPWRYPGSGYLGYGVIQKGRVERPYLNPGGSFTVVATVKKKVDRELLTPLPWAFKALGLLGGIGARARKGFGSVTLQSLCHKGEEVWRAPGSVQELRASIRELLEAVGPLPDGLPDYTAFSSGTRVSIVMTGGNALHLLDEVGKELIRYRSYGRTEGGQHLLLGNEPAEQNFADDHHLMVRFIAGQKPARHPRRVVFGLPHNYYFRSMHQNAGASAQGYTRRASPLFIHIHYLAPNRYAAVLTLLPAVFLPQGERIKLSTRGRSVSVPVHADYQVIRDFFDRKNFRDRVEVWP